MLTRFTRPDDGCMVCAACAWFPGSAVISDWIDKMSSMVTGDACEQNCRISWINLPTADILSATRDSESMNLILLLKRAFENAFDFFQIVVQDVSRARKLEKDGTYARGGNTQ